MTEEWPYLTQSVLYSINIVVKMASSTPRIQIQTVVPAQAASDEKHPIATLDEEEHFRVMLQWYDDAKEDRLGDRDDEEAAARAAHEEEVMERQLAMMYGEYDCGQDDDNQSEYSEGADPYYDRNPDE